MRRKGATMLRMAASLSVLTLALLAMPGAADAAEVGGGGPAPGAPRFQSRPATGPLRPAGVRRAIADRRQTGFRHGRARFFLGGSPAFYPFDLDARPAEMRGRDDDVPERIVDRDSFEHMPVRVGVPRAPTPRPVIYRIEGTEARPSVRILRVGIEDRRAGIRYAAGSEGGDAEILILRRR